MELFFWRLSHQNLYGLICSLSEEGGLPSKQRQGDHHPAVTHCGRPFESHVALHVGFTSGKLNCGKRKPAHRLTSPPYRRSFSRCDNGITPPGCGALTHFPGPCSSGYETGQLDEGKSVGAERAFASSSSDSSKVRPDSSKRCT